MSYRLTKIYTRAGDEGYTHLGKQKLSKDDALIEVLGTVDELNSAIGLILSFEPIDDKILQCLTQIQHDLFNLGGELYLPEHIAITAAKILELEQLLDEWNQTLPPLQEFILPRGNAPTAATHVARTVCRRAERSLVKLHREKPLQNIEMLKYLNRLSDLLFVIARVLSKAREETLWEHTKK